MGIEVRRVLPIAIYRLPIYDRAVIRSFRSAETEKIFCQESVREFRHIEAVALRKLLQLHRAKALQDLALPGNRLEKLGRDRKGQHSIRINDQYRVCFAWKDGDAFDVEVVDYH
jgi:proteic killer suppression protein